MNELMAPPALDQDLFSLAEDNGYELIDGELVEKPMGSRSSKVGMKIGARIVNHLGDQPGHVFGADTGFRCFPGRPKLLRKPDVSFIRGGRLPGEEAPGGYVSIAPDLAVEVTSPGDKCDELEAKIGEYFDAGVPLVWVVYPESRTAYVYRPDGTARRLREGDEIDGGDVLPGFRCRLADFFPPVSPEAPSPVPT